MFGIGKIKFLLFKKKWRGKNSHNTTYAVNSFNPDCVTVGRYTYGGINVLTYNNENTLQIGHFCSIAENVKFILSGDHNVNTVSTFPFKVKVMNEELEGISKGNIIVKDDVWIGYGATIMSGVEIGQGAVVAARAVVTKNVPPYAIVGGVPAKIIKYRYPEDIVSYLEEIDYSKLDKIMIEDHISELYSELGSMSLDNVKNSLAWFPRKKK